VDLGNPHAVLFDAPTPERAASAGPPIERAVPRGVNVGFARAGPSGIDLVVWERGAGLTGACGTGACAAVVAAITRGAARAGAPVEVRQPGGALTVTASEDLGRVVLRGPAERVLTGEADL
jgi:diaminopimelate epimerase